MTEPLALVLTRTPQRDVSDTFLNLAFLPKLGMLTTFPQCSNSLDFPELISQNHIYYHRLSMSWISKIVHLGILYFDNLLTEMSPQFLTS